MTFLYHVRRPEQYAPRSKQDEDALFLKRAAEEGGFYPRMASRLEIGLVSHVYLKTLHQEVLVNGVC